MKIVCFTLIFSLTVFAQSGKVNFKIESSSKLEELREKLRAQDKFIEKCEAENKEYQLKEFGRILPKIAGECEWSSNGCPISLPIPFYPQIARKYGIFGIVKVEIIIDETGKVVFSKAFNGKKIFYLTAELTAQSSQFYPKTICGKKVLQKKIIIYNFLHS